MSFDLEHLIHPYRATTFLAQYWNRTPLLIARHDPTYYAGLLSMQAIDQLLQFGRVKYPDVEVSNQSRGGFSLEVLKGMDTYSMRDYGVPTLDQLYLHYEQGDTILIKHVEQYWQPVAIACRNLELFFHHPAIAMLFLSARQTQGFPAHFNRIGCFILQLEGAKLWRLYGTLPNARLNQSDQPFNREELPPLDQEIYLQAGDLLYVPPGCIHEVLTTDSASLHVSIGIEPFTWKDLMQSALETMAQADESLLEPLPVAFLNADTAPAMQERLADLLDRWSLSLKFDAAFDHLAQSFIGRLQPLPDGRFAQLSQSHSITLDTRVTKRQGIFCWVRTTDTAQLQFLDRTIKAPLDVEPALRFVAQHEIFTVRSLPQCLSDNSKLVLVRRLIQAGLLHALAD